MRQVDRDDIVTGTKFLLVAKHTNDIVIGEVISKSRSNFYYKIGNGRVYVLGFTTTEVLPVPDLRVIPLDYMDWYVEQGEIRDQDVFLAKLSGDWNDVVDKITGRNL